MTRDLALKQSADIQYLVADRLRALGKTGFFWALTGGSTEDDGESVRVTIHLETRYAAQPEPTSESRTD